VEYGHARATAGWRDGHWIAAISEISYKHQRFAFDGNGRVGLSARHLFSPDPLHVPRSPCPRRLRPALVHVLEDNARTPSGVSYML
ncbi:hypothetical protein ACC690_38175, partial [Rhizobium johnstonii]|uniref:hypothetical protein n=1 Tax=Rhizobium johnstonii TaxID=3019933 RepID=UPI003F98409E